LTVPADPSLPLEGHGKASYNIGSLGILSEAISVDLVGYGFF